MRAVALCAALALLAAAAAPDSCGGRAYEPCAGKACGDACTVCAPDDRDCAETAVVKACNLDGVCVADGPDLCWDPCAGKGCGAACDPCPPDARDCAEPAAPFPLQCSDIGLCRPMGSFVCP